MTTEQAASAETLRCARPDISPEDIADVLAALDAAQAAVTKWEDTLSAVMPADFKDWHANSRAEWPEMAAWVIQNLREREAAAQAPREAPRLTDGDIDACIPVADGSAEVNVRRVEVLPGVMGQEYEEAAAWSLPLVRQISRAVEARVRELCGVAP